MIDRCVETLLFAEDLKQLQSFIWASFLSICSQSTDLIFIHEISLYHTRYTYINQTTTTPPPSTHTHMVIFKTLLEFLDISKTSSVHYYHWYFYTTRIMYSSFCALSPVKKLRNINRLKYHKHCTIIYCISIIYNQVSAKASFINRKFKPE